MCLYPKFLAWVSIVSIHIYFQQRDFFDILMRSFFDFPDSFSSVRRITKINSKNGETGVLCIIMYFTNFGIFIPINNRFWDFSVVKV